jgi:hypothetical protein
VGGGVPSLRSIPKVARRALAAADSATDVWVTGKRIPFLLFFDFFSGTLLKFWSPVDVGGGTGQLQRGRCPWVGCSDNGANVIRISAPRFQIDTPLSRRDIPAPGPHCGACAVSFEA